ncbi:MAG: hypothetical protein AB8B79_13995 [Granulosicoccus sp.]
MNTYCTEQNSCTDLINSGDHRIPGSLYEETRSKAHQAYRRLSDWLKVRHERKINRDAFSHLLKLEDDLLDDIGVTRDSVRWAASLPLSVDASRALEETARGRCSRLSSQQAKQPQI